MRTVQGCWFSLRALVEKISLFHRYLCRPVMNRQCVNFSPTPRLNLTAKDDYYSFAPDKAMAR
jgi:hypothetical protein